MHQHAETGQSSEYRHPTFFVLLGPDGSGKSSVADALTDLIREGGRSVARYHWRPRILWSRKTEPSEGTSNQPHLLPERGWLLSFFCYLYFFADFVLFSAARLRLRKHGHIIVYERYFYDVRVHPRRYKLRTMPRLAAWLCYWIPKPDRIVVLVGDSEIIHSRKPELPLSEIDRQAAQLRNIFSNNSDALFFDVTKVSAERIAQAIVAG